MNRKIQFLWIYSRLKSFIIAIIHSLILSVTFRATLHQSKIFTECIAEL